MENMNKEEQQAIEELKKYKDWNCFYNTGYLYKAVPIDNKYQQAIQTVLNCIDKLQEENKYLREREEYLEKRRSDIINKFQNEITDTTIPKDKIKEALGNKEIPDEMILIYIETLVSENSRLEDIEDRKVQIEYNNVFNKGVKSVEAKIKEALDYIEENSFEDTTGVVLNLQDESYWKLWKILKGE